MRSAIIVLFAAAFAPLTGCHPKPLPKSLVLGQDTQPMRIVIRLHCPAALDGLIRTGQAGDGQNCTYVGPRMEGVTLLLAPLDGGSAAKRLAAVDAALRAEIPGAPHGGPIVSVATGPGRDQARIDLPGFHLNASDGSAGIRLPGVAINADGGDASVTTGTGGARSTVVDAHDGGAEVRTGGVSANGTDATYLLASDAPGPSGDRAAGYVAKGPVNGPLVIGEFHVRQGAGDRDRDGVERLVDLNVHG